MGTKLSDPIPACLAGMAMELFQIWLNLPRADKFVDPHYTMLWGEQMPVFDIVDEKGLKTSIELVAGTIGNKDSLKPAPKSWAANSDHEVGIWIVEMEPGAKWSLPLASTGVNRTLYFFEGASLVLNGSSFEEFCAIELESHLEVRLENGPKKGRFLVL